MAMINPALVSKGETSTSKTIKYRGTTTPKSGTADGHVHNFVVYEDDTIEIMEHIHDAGEGVQVKHTHEYVGDYPNGYIIKDPIVNHTHKIISIEQPIQMETNIFGNGDIKKKIDTKFSELFNQEEKPSIDKFFKDYAELFYDIPQKGTENTHTHLIRESLEYVQDFEDPRDKEIEELLDRIVELEQELSKKDALQAEKEHPIFKNGTFLKEAGKPTVYYMMEGRKRAIKSWDTYTMLKRAQGHLDATPDEEVWIIITEDVVKGIDSGPEFREEDMYGGEEDRVEAENKKIVQLDPDDFKINPSNYPTTSDYIEALDREVRQKAAKEDYLESLQDRYERDLGSNITMREGEAVGAQERLDDVTEELEKTREAIIRYSKILEAVDPDGDLKNIEIDTSQLKDIVTGEMDSEITKVEKAKWHKEVFLGEDNKSRMQRFINDLDKSPTNEREVKKNAPTQSNKGSSPAATEAADEMLEAMGMGGMTESKPSGPPSGFRANKLGTIRNTTISQMAKYSKIGVSSEQGSWYWAPKHDYQDKLKNPLPLSSKISKYIWESRHFEWVPKSLKRMFHGRVVDNIQ